MNRTRKPFLRVGATTMALLLGWPTLTAGAQTDFEVLLERSTETLFEEIAVLGEANAFSENDTVNVIVEELEMDLVDRAELLDELDFIEEDNEVWLAALKSDGLEVSPDVEASLSYSPDSVERSLLNGEVGFADPTPWLNGLSDLIKRLGQSPIGERPANDHDVIIEVLDELDRTDDVDLLDYLDPAFTITEDGVEVGTEGATVDQDLTTDPAPDGETDGVATDLNQAADPTTGSEKSGSFPLLPVAGGLVVLLAVAAALLMWRKTKPGSSATAAPGPGLNEVLDTSRAMTAALDARSIWEIAVRDAMSMTKAEASAIALRTDGKLHFAHSTNSELFSSGAITSGVLHRVVETGQPTQTVSHDDPGFEKLPIALAAAPIVAAGQVVGALVVLRVATEPFAEAAASALKLLCPVTGSALAAAATHDSAVTAADIDGLTKLHNRRRLDRDLSELTDSVGNIGFAMIDVDHFKNFNDTNGHGAGDVALQAIADAISTAVREDDTVYRYGGEEFSVLLRGCTPVAATEVMERVRASVERLVVPGGENQPLGKVTVSVGLALGTADTVGAMPKSADDALYEAKEGGRNQVVLNG